MPGSLITYIGLPCKVVCDGRCDKAWGICNRPRVFLSNHVDDYEFMTDGEVGYAPVDPGTYEGCHAKPKSVDQFPNKWCVRECERCAMSEPGQHDQPLEHNRFDVRQPNINGNDVSWRRAKCLSIESEAKIRAAKWGADAVEWPDHLTLAESRYLLECSERGIGALCDDVARLEKVSRQVATIDENQDDQE